MQVKGAEYLVSFGIGAMVVTLVLGAAYAAVRRATGRPLPSLQVRARVPSACSCRLCETVTAP
jgi:hypothetical protein